MYLLNNTFQYCSKQDVYLLKTIQKKDLLKNVLLNRPCLKAIYISSYLTVNERENKTLWVMYL